MSKLNIFMVLFCIQLFNKSICSDLYSDKVRTYDSESFKSNVGASIPHFVNFFAPWCGYCKRLKPVWDELAEKYNVDSSNQRIVIAKVDCTSETPLCAEENVSGYPSLIFYGVGEKKGTKYQGKRDVAGLEDFISENIAGALQKKTIPAIVQSTVTSSVELTDENFFSTISYGFHFVKFYAPWCGHCQKMAPAWEELAQNSDHDKSVIISSVDCTKNKKSCQEFDVKGYPTLLWIVDGKKVKKYEAGRNLDAFKKFITEMKEAHKERLENEEGRIPDLVENIITITPVRTPQGAVYSGGYDNLLSLQYWMAVLRFIISHLCRQNGPLLRSTLFVWPDLVVELTQNNFDNAITRGYTFVKFYVPWCGHSKKLAPTWNDLAIKFSPEVDVKIAKVNCVENEKLCEQYKVVGYPTLLLYHNGEQITEYSGPRKLEQLHIFLLDYLHHTEL